MDQVSGIFSSLGNFLARWKGIHFHSLEGRSTITVYNNCVVYYQLLLLSSPCGSQLQVTLPCKGQGETQHLLEGPLASLVPPACNSAPLRCLQFPPKASLRNLSFTLVIGDPVETTIKKVAVCLATFVSSDNTGGLQAYPQPSRQECLDLPAEHIVSFQARGNSSHHRPCVTVKSYQLLIF